MPKKRTKCKICEKEYTTYNDRSIACSITCLSVWRSQIYKGRKFTSKHIEKLNESKRRENVVKYGNYECEKCGKKFETNTSLRSHRAYCNAGFEKTNVECSICGKKFKRQRALTWHMKLHSDDYRKEHIEKIRNGIKNRPPQKRTSNPEIRFFEHLKRIYGDEVIHKYRIDGVNHEFDFYVPSLNLIVEFDGDYWHGNKELHELDNRMKRQFRIDFSYTKKALLHGYQIHRVWDSKSNDYPNNLREIINDENSSKQNCVDQEKTCNKGLRHTNKKEP